MENEGQIPEFLIQTRLEQGGVSLQSSSDAVVKGNQKRLEQAAQLARETGSELKDVFKELAPDKGAVEFALTFEGEAGLPVLAKGKVGASITVTLEWNGSGT